MESVSNNYSDNAYKYRLAKLEKAMLFEEALLAELLEARKTKKEIIKNFDRCMSASRINYDIYDYLFRYLGIKVDENSDGIQRVYNKTAANEISKWASKFVENVFPQDAENFLILATEKCVDALAGLYPEYSRAEVENRVNQVLREITTLVSSVINNGKFFNFFLDEVKIFFVRQFNCMIVPAGNSAHFGSVNVIYKQIPPLSIAYDFNDEKDVVGVYRKFQMTLRNAMLSYPDFDISALGDIKKEPETTLNFRECCYLKFIDALGEFRWVYIIFTDNQEIAVFRLLKFNPFLTFCETMPYGSSVGRGMFFNCYCDVLRSEKETKLLDDTLKQASVPPIELVQGKVLNLDELNNEIKPGQVIKVSEQGVIRPVLIGERPDILSAQVAKTEETIRNSFTTDRYEPEKSDTATAVTVNVSREVAYLSSHYGKVLKNFIDQLVTKTLLSLEETGDIYNCLIRFFNEDPMARLPLSIFTNDVMAQPELMNDMLDWFVSSLVDMFSDAGFLHIKVLSNLGLKQRYDDINRFVGILQMFTNISGLPPSTFFSFDKFLDKTINAVGIDRGVFLSEKERNEMKNNLAMMAQQGNN